MLFPYHFFFHDTATTEIYTLSLHDALPIFSYQPLEYRLDLHRGFRLTDEPAGCLLQLFQYFGTTPNFQAVVQQDRKSTRLNSSHPSISYAVFCLKKKKKS